MPIRTQRLTLRAIAESDLDAVHLLHSMPEIDRYNTMGIPNHTDETRAVLAGWLDAQRENPPKRYTFLIKNEVDAFLGLTGIIMGKPKYRCAEIWYKIHPSYWNKGYATELVNGLLNFSFGELNLHRIEAGCAVKNTASAKVLIKAGFKQEGATRKKLPVRGEWLDGLDFAILEEDFKIFGNG